jgi:hypothetical protein
MAFLLIYCYIEKYTSNPDTEFLNQIKEGSNSFQTFGFIDKDNFLVNSVVQDISSQIVEIEGFTDLISESTGSGHSLELQSGSSSTFNITELEETSGQTGVGVEEFPGSVVIFGELDVVDFSVEFTVIVDDMHGFFGEKLGEFGVLVQHISQIGFLEIGVQSSVSKSGVEQEPRQDTEELETEGNIREHVEGKGETGKDV